jgi:hypothetical protein
VANIAPTRIDAVQQAVFGDAMNCSSSQSAIVVVNGHAFFSHLPANRADATEINAQIGKLKQLADPTVPKIESKEADRG